VRATGISAIAAQSEGQSRAHLAHTLRRELSQPASEALLVDRHDVVEVGRAGLAQSIFSAESDFRRDSSKGRSDGRYGHAGEIGDGTLAGQDEDWPLFVRPGKAVESDLAPFYGS